MLPFECDPQDQSIVIVAYCACGCRWPIHFGDDGIWRYDGDYFANAEHYAKWNGAERMDGIWS